MKIYKEYMDSVKAPEELIERTGRKIQAAAAEETSASSAEERMIAARGAAERELSAGTVAGRPSSGSRRVRYLFPAACAAAAAIVLSVLFPGRSSSPEVSRQTAASQAAVWQTAASQTAVWQTVSVSAEKQLPETGGSESAEADSGAGVPGADAFFSADRLEECLPGFEKVREEHSAGSSVCYLRKETASARYLLSADGERVPEELKTVKPQDIGGTEVRLAVSPDGMFHYAVWETGGITHFVTLGNFPEEGLEVFLKIFSEKL